MTKEKNLINKKIPEKIVRKKSFEFTTFLGDILRGVIWFYLIIGYRPVLHFFSTSIQINIGILIVIFSFVYLLFLILSNKKLLPSFNHFIRFYWRLLIFIPRVIVICLQTPFLVIPRILKPIARLSKNIIVVVFMGVLTLISVRNIVLSSSTIVLYISITVLTLCLILCLISLISWTSEPYSYYGQIGVFADFFLEKIRKWHLNRSAWDKTNLDKNKAVIKQTLIYLATEYRWLVLIEEKFINLLLPETNTKIELIKEFILRIFYTVIFDITVFAFDYFALYKIDGDNFIFTKRVSLFDYFYFSASTFTTPGGGSVIPNSILVKSLAVVESFSGMFFITVVIFSFSLLTEQAARATCIQWKENIRAKKDLLFSLIEKVGLPKEKLKDVHTPNDLDAIINDEFKDVTSIETINHQIKNKAIGTKTRFFDNAKTLSTPMCYFTTFFYMTVTALLTYIIFLTKMWLSFKFLLSAPAIFSHYYFFVLLYVLILDYA